MNESYGWESMLYDIVSCNPVAKQPAPERTISVSALARLLEQAEIMESDMRYEDDDYTGDRSGHIASAWLRKQLRTLIAHTSSDAARAPLAQANSSFARAWYQQPTWQNHAVFRCGWGWWTTDGARSVPSEPEPSGYSAVVVRTDHGDSSATWRKIIVDTDMPPGARLELRVSQGDVYASWEKLTEIAGPYGASFEFEYQVSSPASQTTTIMLGTFTGVFMVRRLRFIGASNMPHAT